MPIPQKITAEDRFEILDTFLRVQEGIDTCDAGMIRSAFTQSARFDFSGAARFAGVEFPVLEGRDEIVEALIGSVGRLDTLHQVSNPRIALTDVGVSLTTVMEADHFPPGDHSRHFSIKSRHSSLLVNEDGAWLIASNEVHAVWIDGDAAVLSGN
jgi:hypothetical protein